MAALIPLSDNSKVPALEQHPSLRAASAWEQPEAAPGPGATQGHRGGDKPA